jgi:hypothetical protein
LFSRLMVLMVGAGLFGAVGWGYAQQWMLNILVALSTDGAIAVMWALAAAALGHVLLKLLRADARGALGFATAAALGLGVYSLAALGLGLAGWLNRWTTLALPVMSVAFWLVVGRKREGEAPAEPSLGGADILVCRGHSCPHRHRGSAGASPSHRLIVWLQQPAGWGWLWLLAVPSLTIMILGACMLPGWLWKPLDPHPYDVMVYHLQVPREWYEAGRIMPLGHNIYSYFPFNAEMHYLMAMHLRGGPLAGMYLAQFMSVMFMVLTLIGVAGGIPGDSRGKTGGIIAAVLTAAVPWVPMLGAVAYVESALLLYATLSLAWLLRAMESREQAGAFSMAPFVIAGLLAGFAGGVKYTGVPTVLLALPAACLLIASAWHGRLAHAFSTRAWASRPCHDQASHPAGAGRILQGSIIFVIAGLLVFSPWMIRNWAWVGNPVFPMEMRHLGHDGLSDAQIERWDRAHRAPEPLQPIGQRLRAGWNGIVCDWQYGYVLLPAAVVAGIFARRRREIGLLGLLLIVQLIFWLGFTHLAARFAVLAVPIAAIMVGVALSSRPAVGAALAILATAAGMWGLHPRFSNDAAWGRKGLFLLDELAIFNPPEIAEALKDPNTKIALIGNSQAFWYELPMSRLEYRMIFNIDFPTDRSVVDAWLGRDVETLRKSGYIVLIHPDEIRRLSKTYWQVPGLPPELRDVGEDQVILLPK